MVRLKKKINKKKNVNQHELFKHVPQVIKPEASCMKKW